MNIEELGVCVDKVDGTKHYFDDKLRSNYVSIFIRVDPSNGESRWEDLPDKEFKSKYNVILKSAYGRIK